MKLSTKSRYGVRFMTALARGYGKNSLLLKNIAADEEISEKYLSLIVIPLRAAGLVNSLRGARGGYSLARPPQNITLCEVVEALEGETCLVRCVKEPSVCERITICPTREVWSVLGNKFREALQSITIAEVAEYNKEIDEKSKK